MNRQHTITIFLIMVTILIGSTTPLAYEMAVEEKYYQISITEETPTVKKAIKKATGIITESVLDNLTHELKNRYWLYEAEGIEEGTVFETFLTIPENYLVDKKDLEININVPERKVYLLQKFNGDKILLKKYPCAVGTKKYKTPLGARNITDIKWNPWWYPPPSPWAKDEKITPPGPKNPLGKVALVLGECFLLHGTNSPRSIGRVVSHGCMRMFNEDAIELASFLQKNDTQKNLTLNYYLEKTINYPLQESVAVKIIYESMVIDEEKLIIFPDIYEMGTNRKKNILEKLTAAGINATKIDGEKILFVLKKAAVKKQELLLSDFAGEEWTWEE